MRDQFGPSTGPSPARVTFADLSQPRRALFRLIHHLYFGRVERLLVRAGEPELAPPPQTIQEWKFAGENVPRPGLTRADALLKAQHLELLVLLDRVRDGQIDVLEVHHGLPFRALLTNPLQLAD
jgi:hypothetical protein